MERLPGSDLLEIHKDRLEDDAQGNPKLSFEWGVELAKAARRVKELKGQLKLTGAQVAMEARNNCEKFGLKKVTDEGVKDVVLVHPEYRHIQDQLIQAEYEEDILQQFMYAMSDRKQQITNMIQLHGQMYWAKPDTSGQAKENRAAQMAEVNARVKSPRKSSE